MNKKHLLLIGVLVLGVAALASFLSERKPEKFGAGVPTQVRRDWAEAIGTDTVPLSLTSSFTGGGAASSSAINAAGLHNFVFSGEFTPTSYGSILQIQVQRSLDEGLTYRPYNILEVQSDEVLVHTSGTTGIPFTIPGSGTSASGTAISIDFDITMIADYIKVFAREITTSTAGTAYVRVNMQSN